MKFKYPIIAVAVLLIACLVFRYWLFAVPTFEEVKAGFAPSEAYLLDRHGVVIDSLRVDMKVRRLQWTPLPAISPAIIQTVIEGEDHRYWQHHGVDWISMGGAARAQLFARQRRGASTISMQLAALVSKQGHGATGLRAFARKLSQMRMAWSIERSWSKQQILEAYLNLVTFKGELQGISAASQVLAGKSPDALTVPESMILAALLPAPNASQHQVIRRACIRARHHDGIPCEQLKLTGGLLLDSRNPVQNGFELAPHVARRMLTQPGLVVPSTLDASIQQLSQSALDTRLAEIADHNARDGAVLVVDNDSGDVLAYVGSSAASMSQHVDGVMARRQAGSTLKPFLYELALEKHYLTAASLLNDSPLNLDTAGGTYLPQDYDHDYKGLVSVRTALASSLNVPAVRALTLTGVEPFRSRLFDLGYAGIVEDGNYYGYSLALGSAEVSLWEQTQAFRALARQGQWSSIHLQHQDENEVPDKPRVVLSPQASFIVADMMSDRAARVLTFGLSNHLNTSFWSAVKTGTSKDMRDNWCIGFSQKYTVAVWVGNFEGDAMHNVSGVTGAAPIWQDIMLALHEAQSPPLPVAPADIQHVLTSFRGRVEPQRLEWFIRGTDTPDISPIERSHEVVKIESPANGMIIAVDPDIPADYQRVPITIRGATKNMIIRLNDAVLGRAGQSILWQPVPGSYHLTVEDAQHRVADRILFTVR